MEVFTLTIENHTYEIHMTSESAESQRTRINRINPALPMAITSTDVDSLNAQKVTVLALPQLGIANPDPVTVFLDVIDLKRNAYGVAGKVHFAGLTLPVMWDKLTRSFVTSFLAQ